MMKKIKQRCNQKGFTLVELMVVIAILGILAAIAIPKFGDATATANTAKIQADLRTIDAAIVMHQAQKGTDPTSMDDLISAGLLVETPTPPVGKCFVGKATSEAVPGSGAYSVDSGTGADKVIRANLGGKVSSEFKKGTATT